MREQLLLVAIYIQWMKLESIIYPMYNSRTVSKFDIFISIMLYRASKLWSNIELILAIGLKMQIIFYFIYQFWATPLTVKAH